jgi:hypothetical protein
MTKRPDSGGNAAIAADHDNPCPILFNPSPVDFTEGQADVFSSLRTFMTHSLCDSATVALLFSGAYLPQNMEGRVVRQAAQALPIFFGTP